MTEEIQRLGGAQSDPSIYLQYAHHQVTIDTSGSIGISNHFQVLIVTVAITIIFSRCAERWC